MSMFAVNINYKGNLAWIRLEAIDEIHVTEVLMEGLKKAGHETDKVEVLKVQKVSKYIKPVWTDIQTICLTVRPCSWRKCCFCGFEKGTDLTTTALNVWEQLDDYKIKYGGFPPWFKIFNSGSFFDFEQLQVSWKDIVKYLKQNGVEKLRVESRPEFIPDEKPEIEMEVCIGLETVFPNRSKEINKGFNFEKVKEVVSKNDNFKYVIYILAKPYVSDNETAKKEFEESIKLSLSLPNVIQVHAMYCRPAKGTKLNELWNEGKWLGIPLSDYYEVCKRYAKKYPVGAIVPFFTYDRAMPWFCKPPKKKIKGGK